MEDIWIDRWSREKVEKQVSRGPLHVLHRKCKLWLLRGRAVEAKVYVIPALLKSLPEQSWFVCGSSIIINSTLFNFPSLNGYLYSHVRYS